MNDSWRAGQLVCSPLAQAAAYRTVGAEPASVLQTYDVPHDFLSLVNLRVGNVLVIGGSQYKNITFAFTNPKIHRWA